LILVNFGEVSNLHSKIATKMFFQPVGALRT